LVAEEIGFRNQKSNSPTISNHQTLLLCPDYENEI
jgi:hypothetical protein